MAPQFEHSALTPPGAELLLLFCCEEFTGVALGPVERVLTDCVRTLRDGRLLVVVVVVFAPGPELGPMRDGVMVRGTTSSMPLSAETLRRAADFSILSSSTTGSARAAWGGYDASAVATFISTSS